MKLLLVGDVHGRWNEFNDHLLRLHQFYRFQAVLQLGDFGLYPEILKLYDDQKIRFIVPVYVIDGNHEDHLWLAKQSKSELKSWSERFNLHFFNRGHVFNWHKSKIGVIGGALNVDRPQKNFQGVANYITKEDREKVIHSFNKHKIDCIVSHSCPSNIGIEMKSKKTFEMGVNLHIRAAGFDPGPESDCGEKELTEIWYKLNHKPVHWIFAHFHQFHLKKIAQTNFWALPEFDCPPILFWDNELKEIIKID
ncbi:MAG: metallophosphoesterase [Oligoflexia bacterium]|nr:metallophosphoesterase [Oligoflexia bacterium]